MDPKDKCVQLKKKKCEKRQQDQKRAKDKTLGKSDTYHKLGREMSQKEKVNSDQRDRRPG